MGDIADAMINGDMSWDGEWLGDGEGFPRNADGTPFYGGYKGPKTGHACPVCEKPFATKRARRQHMGAKHEVRFGQSGEIEPYIKAQKGGAA